MAAVARVAAPLVLALVLAGCVSREAPPPTQPAPSTRQLTATTTSGPAEVGSFTADPGDLWVSGRCSGGDLQVRVDPVAVLPIPCQSMPGGQFLNQIVMARFTTITVSVSAPASVTWELRVHQD